MFETFKYLTMGVLVATFFLSASVVKAEDILDQKQCRSVVKDTYEAIDDNPALGGKSEKILLAIMVLAEQRCDEKQFKNAKDLLDLARGMAASE